MYHHSGFFSSSHEAHAAISGGGGGGEEAFGAPLQTTMNYSDLSLMGGSSSLADKLRLPGQSGGLGLGLDLDLDLDLHRQFGFDLKQELGFQHCSFDPSLFRMMDPRNSHPSSEVCFGEIPADAASAALQDSRVNLGLPEEQALGREMFHSMTHEYCGLFSGSRGSGDHHYSFGGGLEEGYVGQIESPQLINGRKKIRGKKVGEKHEKQRRERLTKKYDVLKELIPNPTKPDRATIVADTISYINELLRTINELKILIEKKRCRRERSLRLAMADEAVGDMDYGGSSLDLNENASKHESSLRSSWIQRKSKEALVDVRIIEDEATIKLTQRRKMDVLLVVSKALDELQLELLHLSGGNIGDYHIFLFNTKIHESSSLYASAIAKKIVEVLDLQCPANFCLPS